MNTKSKRFASALFLNLFSLLVLGVNIGCEQRMNDRKGVLEIIGKLQQSEIQSLSIARVNVYPPEYIECPEEIDYFKKIIIPSMTTETDKRKDIFAGEKVKVKLASGEEYYFLLAPTHWQAFTQTCVEKTKEGEVILNITRGICCKLNKPQGLDADLTWRFMILSGCLLTPRSKPPELPASLGESKVKYEKYFQGMSEASPLNKRRLASFFQKISKEKSTWAYLRKEEDKYFDELGDFLLKKGDNITYDDFLKIIDASSANSDAPTPSKWKSKQ